METSLTDDGIRLDAPDRVDDFTTAGTAAVLMAENIEGRYGEDADLAEMLRTANHFAVDVRKFAGDPSDEADADAEPVPRGQFVDVLLLGMAASWFARTLDRDHNTGMDPEDYHQAAETMCDAWDTLFREQGIRAIVGDLPITEHRYGP